MFDNLVESGSHKQDVARKGSFILITLAVYAVLIVAAAIAGIMLATANIDQQTLELTALIAPVPVQQQQKQQETALIWCRRQFPPKRVMFLRCAKA